MASTHSVVAHRVVLRDVSFSFVDAAPLLEHVDLSLGLGWSAIVGANGAGKSTLLRLIEGTLVPTAGTIERPGPIVTCPQSVEAVVDRALAERDDRDAFRLRAALALDPSDLDRWPTLSPGERRRWQIGTALASEPDVLLLDEPTRHLDGDARALLIRALRSFRGIGVLVSHDRALLEALTTATVRVERGCVRTWAGSYLEARAAWEREAEAVAVERERRRRAVRQAERALDHARREHASSERSLHVSGRARSKHDADARTITASTRAMWAEAGAGRAVSRRVLALDRAEQDLEGAEPARRARGRELFLDFAPCARRSVLSIDAPELRRGDRVVLRDVRLSLGPNDRIRLCGPNGAGKTTLLSVMLAACTDQRILFVPQQIEPADTARAIAGLRLLPSDAKGRALSLIAALGADPGRILDTGTASPGEARQIAVASGLASRAHTVVLDEPTNDLDLPALERLEDALAAFPGALLVVTHDDAFAERLALAPWSIVAGRVR